MSFEKWGYDFDGAYTSPDSLQSRSGVYVIWCKTGELWSVLDVGQSEAVKTRLQNHDRAACWQRNCHGVLYYAATYIDSYSIRLDVEQRFRNLTSPPCGER